MVSMSQPPAHFTPRDFALDLKAEATPFVVLAVSAASLIAVKYLVMPVWFHESFSDVFQPLSTYVWWAGVYVLAWFALPLVIGGWRGFAPSQLGLVTQGLARKLWMYGVLYLVAMIFVAVASSRPAFLQMYPFLRAGELVTWSWRLLLGFWALYSLQFFCVEFFFRGFMLFTLRPRFGYASIAVMIVPYSMIHFDKPLPEAVAAVVGGTILGWLALRTRSIWGGVLLHIAIAISMDTLAMLQDETGFPSAW